MYDTVRLNIKQKGQNLEKIINFQNEYMYKLLFVYYLWILRFFFIYIILYVSYFEPMSPNNYLII